MLRSTVLFGHGVTTIVSEPSDRQVEAAARAWLEWQFPGRSFDAAGSSMKSKFREGARVVLMAASRESTPG